MVPLSKDTGRSGEIRKALGDGSKGEVVEYSPEIYEAVSNRIMGAYFGMVCEIVESGITNIGDLEMALEVGLVMTPPFGMMNKIGVKKALELVEAYAKENPGFKVAKILVKQAASGKPWKIPVVFREDKEGYCHCENPKTKGAQCPQSKRSSNN